MASPEYLPLSGKRRMADPVKELHRALVGRKIESFFPRPEEVTDRILQLARIEPDMTVREPSGGMGDIGDALGIVAELRQILEAKGHKIAGVDFLTHEGLYNRILMNPPFEREQDAEHVRRVFKLLKPGGRLVAVMSEGPFFLRHAKSAEFRGRLDEVEGTTEKLEDAFSGTDAFRQTGVNKRTVLINKPG